MPTVLDACGVALPTRNPLDGRSLMPLLRGADAAWPDRRITLQWDGMAVPRRNHAWCIVSQKWKLVQPCGMGSPRQQHIRDRYAELCRLQNRGERSIEGPARYELYDMEADPGERNDVAAQHPDLVAALRDHYDRWFDEVTVRFPEA